MLHGTQGDRTQPPHPSCHRRWPMLYPPQPVCSILSISPGLGLCEVYYSEKLHLCSRGVWKLLLRSQVYCVKNYVHLLLVCHDVNRLLPRTGWGINGWSAALGLWVSSSCDRWAALSPPVLLRSTFLHVAYPFRMRSLCEGEHYLCHSSVFAVLVSSSQPHAVQFTKSLVCSL